MLIWVPSLWLGIHSARLCFLFRLEAEPTLSPIPYSCPLFLFPVPCSLFPVPCSLFPVPCSLFPVPCSLFPIPYSLFPIPYSCSLFPVPCSLFPIPYSLSPIEEVENVATAYLIALLALLNIKYLQHRDYDSINPIHVKFWYQFLNIMGQNQLALLHL
jgi:hypothetical protein